MLFMMILLGGLTRLTNSGLSMVTWKPITGVFPPINEEEWEAEFNNYKTYPEYQQNYPDMHIEGFKSIFWVEYSHRMFGRAIGFVLFIPLIYFYFKRKISKRLALQTLGLGIAGGVQGFIGWYMVQSGLTEKPQVSHYRLSFHLIFACLIYGSSLWILFKYSLSSKEAKKNTLSTKAFILILLIYIQIASGGLVAGLHAGHSFMHVWVSIQSFQIPWIEHMGLMNLLENVSMVLMTHLCFALIISCYIFYLFFLSMKLKLSKIGAIFLFVAILAQLYLGISTALNYQNGAPVFLSSAHQAGGILLFSLAIFHYHQLKYKN